MLLWVIVSTAVVFGVIVSNLLTAAFANTRAYRKWAFKTSQNYLSEMTEMFKVYLLMKRKTSFCHVCRKLVKNDHPKTRFQTILEKNDHQIAWLKLILVKKAHQHQVPIF